MKTFPPIPTPTLQSQTSHATFPLKGREASFMPLPWAEA